MSKSKSSTNPQAAIQDLCAQAAALIESAKAIADENGISFDFLDMTYTPKAIIAGAWNSKDNSSWNSSDCMF